ncbi:MAG: LysM peptidoglycan-binding domain-containing protein [Planctomycetota bacterium]
MIRGIVYLTGLVTLGLVACVAAVAYKVHEWPWGEYVREGSDILADRLDPRSPGSSPTEAPDGRAGETENAGRSPSRGDGEGRRWDVFARPDEFDSGPARDGRPAGPVRHTVSRGDTLYSISRRYYDDPLLWRRIARANDIRRPSDMRAGRVIVIPPRLAGTGAAAGGARGRDDDRVYDLKLALTPALEAGGSQSGGDQP